MQNTLLSFVIHPSEGLRRKKQNKWWEQTGRRRRQRNQKLAKLKPVWVIPGINTHPTICGICTICPWSTARCRKTPLFQRHVLPLSIKRVIRHLDKSQLPKGKRKDDLCSIEIRPWTCFLSTCTVSLDFQDLSLLSRFQCVVNLLKDNIPVFIW